MVNEVTGVSIMACGGGYRTGEEVLPGFERGSRSLSGFENENHRGGSSSDRCGGTHRRPPVPSVQAGADLGGDRTARETRHHEHRVEPTPSIRLEFEDTCLVRDLSALHTDIDQHDADSYYCDTRLPEKEYDRRS